MYTLFSPLAIRRFENVNKSQPLVDAPHSSPPHKSVFQSLCRLAAANVLICKDIFVCTDAMPNKNNPKRRNPEKIQITELFLWILWRISGHTSYCSSIDIINADCLSKSLRMQHLGFMMEHSLTHARHLEKRLFWWLLSSQQQQKFPMLGPSSHPCLLNSCQLLFPAHQVSFPLW